jgi:pyruvate dehydrogenase E2 component (dihydrolipoamide acetyltransferase)
MAEKIDMPKLGFDMAEGTLVRWVKAEGEKVIKGDILAEIETDKATVEVQSFSSGVLLKHLVDEGISVPVGEPIAILGEPGEKIDLPFQSDKMITSTKTGEISSKIPPGQEIKVLETNPKRDEYLRASPLAKRMAKEHGLDLNQVEGTGPHGRIIKTDIEMAVSGIKTPPIQSIEKQSEPASDQKKATDRVKTNQPVFFDGNIPEDNILEISRLRSIIAKRMSESKQGIPHFYITHIYNLDELLVLRKEINNLLPEDGKISVNDYIVKATALTLREYPNINASIQGDKIVQHGHINIGIAVAVENGLLTIVCKDADMKPLRLISKEISEIVSRARSGKVRPEDIEGSTFSISNLGMYEVDHFIAIINPPETAILAVGSAQKMPVIVGEEIKIGFRCKATISADHRVTDGAEAALFMQSLAKYLENPKLLLL